MCGIYFSLSQTPTAGPDPDTQSLLCSRGPDSQGQKCIEIPTHVDEQHQDQAHHRLYACFYSSVLALRGDRVTEQPFTRLGSDSVLCWNGEAWTIDGSDVQGNDTASVFDLLYRASSAVEKSDESTSLKRVVEAVNLIRGPYALVFYDAPTRRIYFGRDCLGRRSLLRQTQDDSGIVLSSVCSQPRGSSWIEVEADGLYVIQLRGNEQMPTMFHPIEVYPSFDLFHIPYTYQSGAMSSTWSLTLPYEKLNRTLPAPDHAGDSISNMMRRPALELQEGLEFSLRLRLQNLQEGKENKHVLEKGLTPNNLAILFSGGLDCTVLAKMAHDIIPSAEAIDLLNVAFENPRVHTSSDCDAWNSPYELCPDRITGRASYSELKKTCQDREWRFVEVNVPYSETLAHRSKVVNLIYPHNTEMDLSIAYALYFAARGIGRTISTEHDGLVHYDSSAPILLSGLGADELFGGYQRHASAFARDGYLGLINELELDVARLGKRNLGRDDRVISHWGKEVRFPYLDEHFMAWALEVPVWEKCGFGAAISQSDRETGIHDPAKSVLRLTAYNLGLTGVANEKKRAIQFGARTAKMTTGKSKGTHILT